MNITAKLADKPDQGMHKKKRGRGFPYIAFLDQDGEWLGTVDVRRKADFERMLSEAEGMTKIYRTAADKPKSKSAQANAMLLDLKLGRREPEMKELEKAARVSGVDKDLKAYFKHYKGRKPIDDAMAPYKKRNNDKIRSETAGRLYELFKKKTMITDPDDQDFIAFWTLAMQGAVENKDRKTGKKIADGFEKHAKGRFKFILKRLRADLESIG